jgi:hypothetical protein
MSGENIRLEIGELIVDGYTPGEGFGMEVRAELSRLLTERGLPSAGDDSVTRARRDAGMVDLSDARRDSSVGAGVGRAIYGALDR